MTFDVIAAMFGLFLEMFLSEVGCIEVAFVYKELGSLKAVEREEKCVSILTKRAVIRYGIQFGCVWSNC